MSQTSSPACPQIDQLEQFALRALDETARAAIEAHLSDCGDCADLLKDLKANLDLAASIKRSVPDEAFAAPLEPNAVGPYRIVRKLGQGGMGSVYEAEQENPRRTVALKIIRPGVVSVSLMSRFRRESQTLGRLQHPGIAQIFEAGTHRSERGAQPYFVMELVNGPALLRYAADSHLSVAARLDLLARVCDAVQHAHQRGVIHRDLKPDNILIDTTSDPPQPKVLDFGVARVIDPDAHNMTLQTSPGQIVGTVAYMSPEQAGGNPNEIDTRSDVYALGVIGYQLLCGQLPHKVSPASIAESVRAIIQDDPAPLASIDRSLRGDVTTIVGKALSKEKARRYPSAAEMAADIRRHLRDEPITAHPPSTIYQLGKFARRNRGLVAGIAAAFIVLIAGVIGTSIGLLRAQRSRDLAESARHDADASAAEARLEADRQVAVSQFLQDLLGAANPRLLSATEQARGRNVTVVEALDAAARKVDEGALKDTPEVEIAVRRIMGVTYSEIAQSQEAERHLLIAMDMARRRHGEVHRDVADCANSLSKVYRDMGDLPKAEKHVRLALELARQIFGNPHREVATCLNGLGGTLQDMGRYSEAEPLLRESLAMRRELFGDEHLDTATTMNNLALLLADLGKTGEAEALYRTALRTRYKLLGEEHPDIAVVLNNLAFCLRSQGKQAEAETMFRDALRMRRKFLGDEHPSVVLGMTNLGSVLHAQGKLDEAEPLYLQAIETQRRISPAPTPQLASTINNYATLLRDRKMFAECEPLFRESLAIRTATLPPGHPALAVGLGNLASVLRELAKHDEAESLARQAVQIVTAKFGPESGEVALQRMNLAVCLAAAQKTDEAEAELLEAHRVASLIKDKSPVAFARVTTQVVSFYNKTGRPEEAARFAALLPATNPAQ